MNLSTRPASNYLLADLVQVLNRGFEQYFVPIQFTNSTFLNMLSKDGIDLSASRVLLADDRPCGIALIARRAARRASRLAAMGIALDTRGKGAGTWLMKELIAEAHERGEHEMVLEVIEQNQPAVRLYENYGFKRIRRLIGCIRQGGEVKQEGELQEFDVNELGRLITQHGLPDLPWQLSRESITQMDPPARVFRHGETYIAISNPEAEHIVIWSLLVEPQARGRGLGTKMLKRVIANHPGKTWHVPAICPEEFSGVFERAGFERESLSQWQMKLSL
jgi:ribosomal protein S18 acetylase RimI-like enzyme